ncbi:MAG: hypothetical protein MUO62_10275, partial [Anaerolineales bacterium]|nr:hypothetical protein [Anaerolineales bacterium]
KHGYLVSINAINVVHRNLILDGTERWMYYRIREDFSHILSLEATGDAARFLINGSGSGSGIS